MPYIPSSTNIAGPVIQSSATIASHEQLEQERQSARTGFFGGLLGSTALAPISSEESRVGKECVVGVALGGRRTIITKAKKHLHSKYRRICIRSLRKCYL